MPQQPPASPQAPDVTTAPSPPWIEGDILFRTLSLDHQRNVVALLQPLYEQLVLHPQDPFEQLTENSLVYLLWDELLRQCQIGSMHNIPFANHTDRSRHMAELLRSPNKTCESPTGMDVHNRPFGSGSKTLRHQVQTLLRPPPPPTDPILLPRPPTPALCPLPSALCPLPSDL